VNVIEALLVAAAAVFFIVRQFLPRRVSLLSLVILPVVLGYFALRSMPAAIPPAQSFELFANVAIGIAGGLWQAAATRVYEKDGIWWMRGGGGYLLAWVALLAARMALRLAFEGPAGAWGPAAMSSMWMIYMDAAVAWAVRSAVVYLRHPQIGSALVRS
jgi:hypothetical protein